jgi:hypothetical protein
MKWALSLTKLSLHSSWCSLRHFRHFSLYESFTTFEFLTIFWLERFNKYAIKVSVYASKLKSRSGGDRLLKTFQWYQRVGIFLVFRPVTESREAEWDRLQPKEPQQGRLWRIPMLVHVDTENVGTTLTVLEGRDSFIVKYRSSRVIECTRRSLFLCFPSSRCLGTPAVNIIWSLQYRIRLPAGTETNDPG